MRTLQILGVAMALCAAALTAAATEVIGVSNEPIRLESRKGTLIRLNRPAATVFVANPDIADVQVKSPKLIYVSAKEPGETSLYAVDDRDRILLSRRLTVGHNLSRLNNSLRQLIPGSVIDVQSVDGALVLSGTVRSGRDSENAQQIASRMVEESEDLLNHLSVVEPNQIHLKVRIAEVSRAVLKRFDFNWEAVGSINNFAYTLGIGRDFIDGDGGITRTKDASSIAAGLSNRNQSIISLIDALDKEGLVKILAEPSLTAVSGETATFLAGGEFPIIIPSARENRVTIEFKEFGVSLAFTPTVLSGKRIVLKVKPEVSQLSTEGAIQFNGFSIPSLTTRRAQTTVELASGQSFAIAGLLQNNTTQELSKFPGLGDIPILGSLFRSDRFQRDESELVIIVTPFIVRPVSKRQLASPTDGLTPPTDTDRYVHGRLYRPNVIRRANAPRAAKAPGLSGPVGFALN